MHFVLKVFRNFADIILSSAFLVLYELNYFMGACQVILMSLNNIGLFVFCCCFFKISKSITIIKYEPRCEKTGFLHMQKQSRKSASR